MITDPVCFGHVALYTILHAILSITASLPQFPFNFTAHHNKCSPPRKLLNGGFSLCVCRCVNVNILRKFLSVSLGSAAMAYKKIISASIHSLCPAFYSRHQHFMMLIYCYLKLGEKSGTPFFLFLEAVFVISVQILGGVGLPGFFPHTPC